VQAIFFCLASAKNAVLIAPQQQRLLQHHIKGKQLRILIIFIVTIAVVERLLSCA